MKKIGSSSAFALEQLVVECVRTHPGRQEAITLVDHATLARWELDYPPHLLTSTQTAHTRLNAIAVSPDGEMIAVAPAKEPIEFRRWDDLSLRLDVANPISNEATSLAFSPDGRWFALADRHEAISLIDRTKGYVTAEVEGGEWTSTLLFDPTSSILASACSFQGGGYVRLDRIDTEGHVLLAYELDRSNASTLPAAFVDSLIHLAFSPDGHGLALFESSAIYHEKRPAGWRGNIVLYAVETGILQWQASIDAQVTGDTRLLKEVGYPGGFFTELLFISKTEIACGATHGFVLFYDVASGRRTRSIDLQTDAAVRSLSLDKDGKVLWAVLDNGKLVLISL